MNALMSETSYYYRFVEEIGEKLDFRSNIPILINRDSNEIVKLESIVNFIDTKISFPTDSTSEFIVIGVLDADEFSVSPHIKRNNSKEIESSKYITQSGDVLFSRINPRKNRVCVVPDINDAVKILCSTEFYVLRPKYPKTHRRYILPSFLARTLKSNYFRRQILHKVTGATPSRTRVDIDAFKKALIMVPEQKVQRKIVNEVEKLEKEAEHLMQKVETDSRIIENEIINKLGILSPKIYENYFFKSGSEGATIDFYKFPDEIEDRFHYLFYHPKYKILEELGKKYKLVKLKEIVREPIIRGEQPKYSEEGITVIKTVDLKNGYIDYENCLKVSEEFFENYKEQHPEGVLKKGDILIASTGYVSMGKIDIYDRDEPAMADGHISILRVDTEKYDSYFVAYYLRSHLGQIQFDKWWSGSSGQIEIQPQDLGEFLIPESSENGIPLEKQKEIAEEITEKLNELFEKEKRAMEKWEEAKELFEKLVLEGIDNEAAE